MEQLNILITNYRRYNTGGMEVWGRRLATGLLGRGHRVTFCVKRGSQLFEELRAAGFQVRAFPMRGDVDPWTVFPMIRLLKEKAIDVVLSMGQRDFRLAGLATKLAGRGRVVVRLRAVCGHDRDQWRRDFRSLRKRWRYRYFAARAVTNSHRGKLDLVEGGWFPKNMVEMIHNGVDVRLFDPDNIPRGLVRKEYRIPHHAVVTTLIGRINEVKGQLILARAALEILRKHRDVFFLFVGKATDQEYYQRLQELIQQSSFNRERMILTGFRDDVHSILADTDVLVLPSVAEGLPNVVLEAMAMRCPVIATDVGGTREVVEDGVNGFLLPMPIPAGLLCAKLEALLANPEDRERMGRVGRGTVEREFDLRRSVERYEELFYRVLGESCAEDHAQGLSGG